jgi:hypothetical protein
MNKVRHCKRVVIISDLHCAHKVGLTPPSWQIADNPIYRHFLTFEREVWKFYVNTIKALQPIDILIVNGDCIEGKGEKSGSTELIEADRNLQCDIAAECINICKAKDIVMTFGTGYHTGNSDDFEHTIAGKINAKKIGGHEWLDVNGVIFDLKHKVNASGIPQGRATALLREQLWNARWHDRNEGQPLADIIIRSHTHYHMFVGDPTFLAMTTPALQGYGSKYGVRDCSGIVDIGLIHFDVDDKGGYTWGSHMLKGDFLKVQPIKL